MTLMNQFESGGGESGMLWYVIRVKANVVADIRASRALDESRSTSMNLKYPGYFSPATHGRGDCRTHVPNDETRAATA